MSLKFRLNLGFSFSIIICSLAYPLTSVAQPNAQELREAKTVRYDRERKSFSLNEKNREYFQLQRDHLREINSDLTRKYFELNHVIQRLFLARMMKTHAFLYGDPGGAKSDIGRQILGIPYQQLARSPDSELTVRSSQDVFSLQLHQMTSDVAIKGYSDFERFKGNPEVKGNPEGSVPQSTSMRHLIRDEGTLVYFENALLDEVDKGNPIALAALLDVLNEKLAQHGPISLKVRTKTVVCTSNMTIYEFLKVFSDQGMESTARALLDRLPFKVFVPNYITSAELRKLYAKRLAEDQEGALLNNLANPPEYSSDLDEVKANFSSFPDVDFEFLQSLVLNPGTVSSSVTAEDAEMLRSVTDTIVDEMRTKFHQRRSASEVESLNFEDNRPIYYPPSICSTRNCGAYYRAMALSLFLDLLLLPEEKLSTQDLIGMVQKGLPIDIYSTWRLQDILLTAAPGDPRPLFETSGYGKAKLTLEYGNEVTELKKTVLDKRQEFMLQYILEERQDFKQVWERTTTQAIEHTQKNAGILAGLLSLALTTHHPSIEVFLQDAR